MPCGWGLIFVQLLKVKIGRVLSDYTKTYKSVEAIVTNLRNLHVVRRNWHRGDRDLLCVFVGGELAYSAKAIEMGTLSLRA